MTGPVAQMVALTCHGNAFLRGAQVPQFFPANSTCQFCEFIKFAGFHKSFLGKMEEVNVAETPEAWISGLHERQAMAIRLWRTPQNQPDAPDRMLAGFIGGGGQWTIELVQRNGQSEFWMSRWLVGDKNAPERRIWRVTYGLVGNGGTKTDNRRSLEAIRADFKASLEAIHSFAQAQALSGFANCFANGLKALDDPEADLGYHKDLAVPGKISPEAASLLKAAMCAWVFGGMGSWNDMSFKGAAQGEYSQVSERLFSVLNGAIEVAASSSGQE
jgi:hypothetical protein